MKKTIKVPLDIVYQGEFCGDRDNQCRQFDSDARIKIDDSSTEYYSNYCRAFQSWIKKSANGACLRCNECLDYCDKEARENDK